MRGRFFIISLVGTVSLLAGCVSPILAPGAADVRIVSSASDVAGCTAVGNFRQPPDRIVDPRNVAIGDGGNTLFVTERGGNSADPNTIITGVVYRCPK